MENQKNIIGTIFLRNGTYWKVVGPIYNGFGNTNYYPVIKCSKLGKEYKYTNGFQTSFIDCLVKFGEWNGAKLISTGSTVGIKADISAGIESAKLKNRINYLRAKINAYQGELDRLLRQA